MYRHLFYNDSNQILLTRMVYLDRQEHLQKMCHSYVQDFRHQTNLTQYRQMYDHLLVDQKHRLLYCYVPKVCFTEANCFFLATVMNCAKVYYTFLKTVNLFEILNKFIMGIFVGTCHSVCTNNIVCSS